MALIAGLILSSVPWVHYIILKVNITFYHIFNGMRIQHVTGVSKVIDNQTIKTVKKTKTNVQSQMIYPDRKTINVNLAFNVCKEK